MKKIQRSIIMISFLCSLLLIACTNKNEDRYRFTDKDIYIINTEVSNCHELPADYYIIENDQDLELARTGYGYFDELPDIDRLLEDYKLDEYTYYIETVSMSGGDEISLKAILIDKDTNRIYTENDYKRKDKQHPMDQVRFWVRYAIIEKGKIQGLDFTEQKSLTYGDVLSEIEDDKSEKDQTEIARTEDVRTEDEQLENEQTEDEWKDTGSYYKEPDKDDIVYDESIDERYIKNQLLIGVTPDVDESIIENMADSYDAEIVGFLTKMKMYQIEFHQDKTYSELEEIIEELEDYPYITYAMLNYLDNKKIVE